MMRRFAADLHHAAYLIAAIPTGDFFNTANKLIDASASMTPLLLSSKLYLAELLLPYVYTGYLYIPCYDSH